MCEEVKAGLADSQDGRIGMQVIAIKDAEIEILKNRLAATEKQLAEEKRRAEELEAIFKKAKVCVCVHRVS